ncbi:hypothetical protein TNIN_70661 [Trichonephila inaurata madagascariensis]|uniref:Uncharacterized protein n=1 Tax=Trichonephila inaurata madagascariensis TaxID=2747483 RepID=A0A8X7C3I3_9ARAC|nr:hypothetical protein TNIN_70661 [Trichonephila inaurata madagascariensis]
MDRGYSLVLGNCAVVIIPWHWGGCDEPGTGGGCDEFRGTEGGRDEFRGCDEFGGTGRLRGTGEFGHWRIVGDGGVPAFPFLGKRVGRFGCHLHFGLQKKWEGRRWVEGGVPPPANQLGKSSDSESLVGHFGSTGL